MRLVVDTNVFLDVMLRRGTLYAASAEVLTMSSNGNELIIPAHSIPTISYVVQKNTDRNAAIRAVSLCLDIARVGALDEATVLLGLSYGFKDTEDSFVAAIASRMKADYIVTNNVVDFAKSPVRAVTPTELLAELAAAHDGTEG